MPYGLSTEEIEWIRDGYRRFREGDPAFMDRFAHDAEFRFPETLPAGGSYAGPFEAMEFWTTIGELFEDPNPAPEEFLRVADRVMVIGTWRARSRQTGEAIAAPFIHALRVADGEAPLTEQQYTSMEVFTDTAAVLQSLGKSPAG